MRKTRTLLAAMAAGLMTITAIPASAAPQQRHDNAPQQQQRGNDNHSNGGNSNAAYGNWNASWGARPAAPPRSFTRHSDWYRHVRACGQRYKSYNAATDRYTVRRGQTAICRL
jgi:hypothetical protein